MVFISFSCHTSYSNFFYVWFFDLSSSFIKAYFEYIYSEINNFSVMIELINLICLNIADLLAGFFVLYTHINSKSDKENNEARRTSSNQIKLIYNDLSIKKNKYLLIFLISVLELVGRSTDLFYYIYFDSIRIRDGEISWLISIDILPRIIFSKIILKSRLYNHHILSIIMTVIGLCSMSISAFIAINSYELSRWPYFSFIFLKFITIPLEDVINKILLTNKFLLPQTLMFMRGLYNLIMLLIIIPILYFTNELKLDFYFNENEIGYVIQISLLIFFIAFTLLKSFYIMKVIYIFTPQHVAFLNVVFYMIRLLRCRITTGDQSLIIISDSVFLIIIIFSTLLFNEMIVVNVCGLNENTKDGFLIKEKKELNETTDSSKFIESEEIDKTQDSFI
jgi:hypothetical protein